VYWLGFDFGYIFFLFFFFFCFCFKAVVAAIFFSSFPGVFVNRMRTI